MRRAALVLLPLLVTPLALSLRADDWAQFRGHNRDGTSPSRGLARGWPEAGPRVVWKRAIGPAFSGLAIRGERLFTMEAEGEKEWALCLDATTGKELWRTEIGPRFVQEFGDGPRSTPTVDGDHLYLTNGNAVLYALKASNGAKVWSVNLVEALGAEVPRFGFSASPLVDGELVIQDAGGNAGRSIAAFDKKTGAQRWAAAEGPASYSSPIIAEIAGVRQYIFARRLPPPATAELVSLSTKGELLWRHPAPPTVLTMPIFVAPDKVYISSGDDAGALLVRVWSEGGKFSAAEVWKNPRFKNHFNASVLLGDTLYGFDNATFKSLAVADGQQRWAVRGLGKGSLVAADGLLFVLSDEGVLALVEANPAEYRERARAQVMTGRAWTSPSLAGGRLYLRDQDELVCLDLTEAAPAAKGG